MLQGFEIDPDQAGGNFSLFSRAVKDPTQIGTFG